MGSSVWKRPCYVMWLFVAGLATMSVAPAIAHHGWSWAVDEQTTLQGTIQEISMAPPHPSLRVVEANGTVWHVDLANPNQTARSGFTAQSAKPGDAVTVHAGDQLCVLNPCPSPRQRSAKLSVSFPGGRFPVDRSS